MTDRTTSVMLGALALAASAGALAQRDPGAAFTATGASCSQVSWSEEALQRYPRIASACREVLERDGEFYVRFEGEVRGVADRGRRVTIDFEDGDTLTLTPPENMSLTINGRPTAVRDLRPGDELRFYVPEHQLAAAFFDGEPETSEPQEVQISPETDEVAVAQAETESEAAQPRTLPRTASALPTAGAAGVVLVFLGGMLTLRRRLRRVR